jgi:hypothetical protein
MYPTICANIKSYFRYAENTTAVSMFNGIDLVVEIMKKYLANADVSCAACAAVASFASDDSVIDELAAAGACEMLVAILKKHVAKAAVVENAFKAVGNLCSSENRMVATESAKFGRSGGCAALVEAMKRYKYTLAHTPTHTPAHITAHITAHTPGSR